MVTINWCKRQTKGIKLVDPNINLFNEYIKTAEESLDVLKGIKNKSFVWLATTKYYCEYFSIYALLMRMGIKCEIHDCTAEICKILEKEGIIPKGFTHILEEDKQLRIDNQYYLKNREVIIDYNKMVEFVYTCKEIGLKIQSEKIERIRKILEKI